MNRIFETEWDQIPFYCRGPIFFAYAALVYNLSIDAKSVESQEVIDLLGSKDVREIILNHLRLTTPEATFHVKVSGELVNFVRDAFEKRRATDVSRGESMKKKEKKNVPDFMKTQGGQERGEVKALLRNVHLAMDEFRRVAVAKGMEISVLALDSFQEKFLDFEKRYT